MASRRHAAHALGLLLGSVATGTVMSLLLGGLIADRFRKSRLLVVSNILQGMGVGGILLLGRTDPWASLMTCTLTIGRGEGIYRPVYSALLPLIVGKNYIRAANGLRSSTNRVGAIMGSALGGLLIGAFGVRWGMQIDLGTFVVNGILLLSVNDSPSTSDHAVSACRNSACDRVPLVGCRDDTGPRPGFFCGRTGFADASPAVWPHPRFALWIGGFSGRRGGVGRVLDRNRSSHKKPGLYALLALVAQMPQLVVIADHRSVLWLIPCGFVTGLGLSVFGVAWTTAIQVTTPRDMLGRVFTLDALSNSALMPLGLVLAGYLVPRFGVSVVAWTSAVIRAASIIIVLPVPGVSAFGQDPV